MPTIRPVLFGGGGGGVIVNVTVVGVVVVMVVVVVGVPVTVTVVGVSADTGIAATKLNKVSNASVIKIMKALFFIKATPY